MTMLIGLAQPPLPRESRANGADRGLFSVARRPFSTTADVWAREGGRPAARGGLASPNETGRAVLTRTGADARIISMVNPDGFE